MVAKWLTLRYWSSLKERYVVFVLRIRPRDLSVDVNIVAMVLKSWRDLNGYIVQAESGTK